MKQRKECVGDLEADGLLDTATRVWCGVFKDINTNEIHKFEPDNIPAMLEFMDTIDVLIMHNGISYDWPLLEKLYGYQYKGKKVDTLLISRLQRPKRMAPPTCPHKNAPHSVEAWGYRLGRNKPDHDDWSQYSQAMLHRCTEDVEIQHKIYLALIEEAKDQEWDNAHRMTAKLFELLQKVEDYGWKVDQDHMHRCIHFLSRWIGLIDRAVSDKLPILTEILEYRNPPADRAEKGEWKHLAKPFKQDGDPSAQLVKYFGEDCDDVGGPFSRVSFRRVDLNKRVEVIDFLLDEGWEPQEWNYNDNGERTSPKLSKDDPFDGVEGKLGKLIARRVQCRHRMSTITGWFDLIRPDGRIPSIISGIATTSRAKHKNIVNVPAGKSFFGKWMRQVFIADDDKVLVGTDSDACQIRMLAARMGDEDYKQTVLNGKQEDGTDMHTVNQRAAGLVSRDDAKTFFYGIIFGAGDAKTGKIVKGTARDGKKLKEKFFSGLPALGDLVSRLTEEWRGNAKTRWNPKFERMEYYGGWIQGVDGRPIFIESEHQILVYALQSDEAIMMIVALLQFWKLMQKEGYEWGKDYGITCWYHDEWTTECNPDISERVSELAEHSIEWAGKFLKIACPHKGNAEVGINWYEIH